jgi:hypothetical protein
VRLVGSAGDEEPLVDAWVNWGRGELLVLRDVRQLLGGDAAGGVLDGNVGAVGCLLAGASSIAERESGKTYRETSPGWVLPVMSFSHASAHSRTTSVAYLGNC